MTVRIKVHRRTMIKMPEVARPQAHPSIVPTIIQVPFSNTQKDPIPLVPNFVR